MMKYLLENLCFIDFLTINTICKKIKKKCFFIDILLTLLQTFLDMVVMW